MPSAASVLAINGGSSSTVDAVGARADRVIRRIRACPGDVLLFVHRDICRVLAARRLGPAAREGRYFYLATASLSVLGYHHDLDEPAIYLRTMPGTEART